VWAGTFDDNNFNQFTSLEGNTSESIVLVKSPVRAGNYSAKMTVRPGEYVHHGNRAEITHNLDDPPGTVGWYGWSVLIPEDYPMDKDPSHWQIITQFHDQPNLDAGRVAFGVYAC
jgi:hypothetical protein